MHVSEEIQNKLRQLNSRVKLGYCIDGTFPAKYAFVHDSKRRISVDIASSENEFSIILYERTNELNYENCFARGIFNDTVRLATVIDHWVGSQTKANELAKYFPELELFTDFNERADHFDIDKAWTKVKNEIFNRTWFWEQKQWEQRYMEMLYAAKKHDAFKNYYPFTSHYYLRFSLNKEITHSWTLFVYIMPIAAQGEIKFYVSYTEKKGKFFDDVNEALDFYAEKLRKEAPIRWK